MSLGSILLQPQRFNRPASSPELALGEDLLRLLAAITEDLVAEGPLGPALARAVDRMGARIRAQVETRFVAVRDQLRGRAVLALDYLRSLGADAAGADDAAAAFKLALRLLNDLQALLDSFTLPGLRAQAQIVVDVLRNDLGLSNAFIKAQLTGLVQDAVQELTALNLTDDAQRRRRRQCVATFRGLQSLIQRLEFPDLTAEDLARPFFDLLRNAGITQVLAQARCALEEFETATMSAVELGKALSSDAVGGGSVGAGLAPSVAGSEYSWYASWLLGDEDLPLFELDDLGNAVKITARILEGPESIFVFLRSRFSAAQLTTLTDAVRIAREGADDAKHLDRNSEILLLAKINELVLGDLLYDSERFPEFQPSAELREATLEAIADQKVLITNRRYFEELFNAEKLTKASGGFLRTVGAGVLGLLDWPRHSVYVTADRTTIMCDEAPLLIGENLNWYDAPIFAKTARGNTFWIFEHISPQVCEGLAYHSAWPSTLGKAVWHLVSLILDAPGHRIGGGINLGLEFAENLNQIIFGKPIQGYESLGCFGKWLSSSVIGPRGVFLTAFALQGMHKDASSGNILRFFATVLAGDVIRTAGPAQIINTVRDLLLAFVTLLNFGGPRLGPSTLPNNPAQNHQKQGPFASLFNSLFLMWLISYYKREDYSIEIFSAGDIGERRKRSFLLWLAGGPGMAVLTGLTASVAVQIIAWAEDWPRLGITILKSMAHHVLAFWPFVFLQKEGDTDDGKFTTGSTRQFKGYPNKDTSPYLLPWAKGENLFAGQAHMGLWSHNDITAQARQLYAVDFGHDHKQHVLAARSGVIVSFSESTPDDAEKNPGSDPDANRIIIMHTTPVADHDDPYGTGVLTTYARYLHGSNGGITAAFALRGLVPTVGMTVTQGDVIMLADDTGTSFHSHLHFDVLLDTTESLLAPGAIGTPGDIGIPVVFKEIRGEGRPLNLIWYTSENG
jgi:hypothetical protein